MSHDVRTFTGVVLVGVTTVESHTVELSRGERHYLLKGYTDTLPVVQSRLVRIYVSSGFHGNIFPLFSFSLAFYGNLIVSWLRHRTSY